MCVCFRYGRQGLHGKTVLDIGCGTGVVGIVAALLGANVVATDGDETVVDLARRNFQANTECDCALIYGA